MTRKLLLLCGVLSSLLYVGADILASKSWQGYSYTSQAFSELGAIEAPTRPLMIALGIPYNLLVLAFAGGVWACAGRGRVLRVIAVLLAAHVAAGLMGGLVFPMHSRNQLATSSLSDTMHIVFTAIEVLAMLLFTGFAALYRGWFRVYSIATILLMLAGGFVAALAGARLAAGLPTPGLGVIERVNIYASMLWVLVFALVLLRGEIRRSFAVARPHIAAGLAAGALVLAFASAANGV